MNGGGVSMSRFSWFASALISLLLLSAGPAAQGQYRVFVAPITDFALGDDGPTRHEYVMHFQRRECNGIVPTSREDLADFTAWFEFEGSHYVLLWDAQGNLIGSRRRVLNSGNIVKDVCDAIREHVAE